MAHLPLTICATKKPDHLVRFCVREQFFGIYDPMIGWFSALSRTSSTRHSHL